jgi:hypothetical protein
VCDGDGAQPLGPAKPFISIGFTVAVIALTIAAPAASSTSAGFRVPSRQSGPPKVVCATNLPHRSGLYCASPLIRPNTYDQLGVLKLSLAGTVTIIRGGNDILLAIEGDLDHMRPRPTLRLGRSWSADGYHCARTATAVRCWRRLHGFAITTRLRIF